MVILAFRALVMSVERLVTAAMAETEQRPALAQALAQAIRTDKTVRKVTTAMAATAVTPEPAVRRE